MSYTISRIVSAMFDPFNENTNDSHKSLDRHVKKNDTKPDPNCHTVKVIGYEIDFPFSPYGIQRAMMSKLSSTLTNKEHLLLESPTGTGKTLVLLCTTLGWQRRSKQIGQALMSEKLREELSRERLEKLRSRPCACGRRQNTERSELDQLKDAKDAKKGCADEIDVEKEKLRNRFGDGESFVKRAKLEPKEELVSSPYFANVKHKSDKDVEVINIDIDSDDDDVPIKQAQPKTENDPPNHVNGTTNNCAKDLCGDVEIISDKQDSNCRVESDLSDAVPKCKNCMAIDSEILYRGVVGNSAHDGQGIINSKVKGRIPRIYYGTRTHKQITQVVRELNKTPYRKNLKMCILSARERACINQEVRDLPDRNDKCQELIKNRDSSMSKSRNKSKDSCPYYLDSNHVTQEFEHINAEFEHEAWDIEDAAEFGRAHGICPYYGIRGLQEEADITFCPYNYLLDPNIRRTMNINLSNAVVILDEAHNIEDICRDSASYIISTSQIRDIVDTIAKVGQNYIQGSVTKDAYDFFRLRFQYLDQTLRNYEFSSSDNDAGEFLKKKILMNDSLIDFMDRLELGPKHMAKVKENLSALKGDDGDPENKSKTSDTGDPLLSFAQMQFIDQLLIVMDFMYSNNNKGLKNFRLVITQELERAPFRRGGPTQIQPEASRDKHLWKLHLLCMDPGIAFEKIHNLAWSVIVASGTLSPTESLKSELGCTFSNVFEGAHVIAKDRIFASILSAGPKGGVELKCTYKECMRLDFQDEVGSIVRDVCAKVPNGVLVFFPSYERLESFYQRWSTTRVMGQIQSYKKLFQEKRALSAAKFEEELSKYNDHAKKKGAVLFAVFRGKVSEGIDFADKAARAVITIGIPFPNFTELGVNLKKEYNDFMRSTRPQLMSGGDWYSAQAFRALNQALGRCIRHKDDWGAIMMIDSRLRYGTYTKNISKWLRQVLLPDNNYSIIHSRLEDYVNNRLTEENKQAVKDEMISE